jgi:hypothetical protein
MSRRFLEVRDQIGDVFSGVGQPGRGQEPMIERDRNKSRSGQKLAVRDEDAHVPGADSRNRTPVDEDHGRARQRRSRRRGDVHMERLAVGALVRQVATGGHLVHPRQAVHDAHANHLVERWSLFLHDLSSLERSQRDQSRDPDSCHLRLRTPR